MTADDKALTRVCIIDFNTGKVAYDQHVKPPSPITDYLTRLVRKYQDLAYPHLYPIQAFLK